MKIPKKLLYYGQATWGSTSLQRYTALRDLFKSVYLVDSRRTFPDKKSGRTLFMSLQGRVGIGPLLNNCGEILLSEVERFRPDLVWVDGGFLLSNKVINKLRQKNITSIHYTPDSIFAPGLSNLCFKKAIRASISDLICKGISPKYYFISFSGNQVMVCCLR